MRISRLATSSLLIIITLTSFSARAHASSVAEQIARVLSHAASPWESVPNSALRFLVVEDGGRVATAIGFNESELGSFAKERAGITNAVRLTGLDLPAVDFFTECSSRSCGENQSWTEDQRKRADVIADLAKQVGHPILVTSTGLPGDWKKGLSRYPDIDETLVFIQAAFHEAFHMHQDRINKPTAISLDRNNCLNDPGFNRFFATDLSNWKGVVEASTQSKRAKVTTALQFRKDHPHSCFSSLEYRKEGIPNYFAYTFLLRAGIVPKAKLDKLYSTFWLTPIDGQKNLSYFDYGLGAAMGIALEAVSPDSNWQHSVEQGTAVEDLLREAARE